MRKIIILATDAWHPQVNGVVTWTHETKKYLEESGFEVVLIHPGLFWSFPIPFYREVRLSWFPKRKVRRIIRQANPGHIHVVTEGPIGLAARRVCLEQKIKFTTAFHTNFQLYVADYFPLGARWPAKLLYRALRWFHNAGEHTMVTTEWLKKHLESHGFTRIRVSPLGVRTEFFTRNPDSPVRKRHGLTRPVFAYFGRLAKEKNVEEFLRLDLPGEKLVIGDGPLRSSLEKKYGKSARFVGYKHGQELVDYLSVTDVLVFPSVTDVFPLVVIEALACGVPVAAHPVNELHRITPDVGALSNDLREAAIACLDKDPARCREFAMQFSWESATRAFISNLVATAN